MVPIVYLREQAQKCRRLACEVGDLTTAERLDTLACDYDQQADARESDPHNIVGGAVSPDT